MGLRLSARLGTGDGKAKGEESIRWGAVVGTINSTGLWVGISAGVGAGISSNDGTDEGTVVGTGAGLKGR